MKVKSLFDLGGFILISMVIGRFVFFGPTDRTSIFPRQSQSDHPYPPLNSSRTLASTLIQSNNQPVVKILAPKDQGSYPMATRIAYEISVSDPEDGESKYGEISQNEVLLKVEYLEKGGADVENNQKNQEDSRGLTEILKSNCINCHAFKGKLIGPSFYEISKHYGESEPGLQTMVKHIQQGSSGQWGNAVMPAHPELSPAEINEMVLWIVQNAGNESVSYYTGTESSIGLTPTGDTKNAAFLLTASYTDHGAGDGQKLMGQDSIIIYPKKNTR